MTVFCAEIWYTWPNIIGLQSFTLKLITFHEKNKNASFEEIVIYDLSFSSSSISSFLQLKMPIVWLIFPLFWVMDWTEEKFCLNIKSSSNILLVIDIGKWSYGTKILWILLSSVKLRFSTGGLNFCVVIESWPKPVDKTH